MIFDSLSRFETWWYLPLIDSLLVFDARTGDKTSEWYNNIMDAYHDDRIRLQFQCLINTLPPEKREAFEPVVAEWKKYVETRFKECRCED